MGIVKRALGLEPQQEETPVSDQQQDHPRVDPTPDRRPYTLTEPPTERMEVEYVYTGGQAPGPQPGGAGELSQGHPMSDPPAHELDPLGHPGLVRPGHPAQPDAARPSCRECGQALPSDYERIQASIEGVSVTDLKHLVVTPFYKRLFTAQPALIQLFPDWEHMVYPQRDDQGNVVDYSRDDNGLIVVNPEAGQVEQLVQATVALATHFDPESEQKMDALDATLAKLGRSHTRFDPPPTISEYGLVVDLLLTLLAEVLGERITVAAAASWRRALEYASGKMLTGQATARLTGAGRRRRA